MTTQGMGYVDPAYLDAAAALVADGKRRSHQLMRCGPGGAVLDVGCGPGTDTLPLALLVGEGGRVAGIDHDAEMVAEADRRAEAAGVGARVEHRQGDALALPWGDAAFDAARSERLFLHLADPAGALAEMARVTRPGGRVVVADTDWGSRSVDTPEVAAERTMAWLLAERCLANGFSGRRLPGLFRRQGLEEVEIEVFPLQVHSYPLWRLLSRMDMAEEVAVREGYLSPDEVRRLHDSLCGKDADGTFFALTSLVIVAGRVPS
jgi:SAM-dependent methyltransferase